MRYSRNIIAYHGCDADVAERLLRGEPFVPSENTYDWLGTGIYFWEWGDDRALRFAEAQSLRQKVRTPSVVGAVLQLGECLDLLDTRNTRLLQHFYPQFVLSRRERGLAVPRNAGKTVDRELRRGDCAFLNWLLPQMDRRERAIDTIRCAFTEGGPVYPGSEIYLETHVQIAVRNPDCVLGVFRPR